MVRYFTSDVTYSTYGNCNIKIITETNSADWLYEKKQILSTSLSDLKSLCKKINFFKVHV